MASAFSQSPTAFGVGFSRFTHPKDRSDLKGYDLEDRLMFDIDAELKADDMTRPTPDAPKRNTYKSIYPQR